MPSCPFSLSRGTTASFVADHREACAAFGVGRIWVKGAGSIRLLLRCEWPSFRFPRGRSDRARRLRRSFRGGMALRFRSAPDRIDEGEQVIARGRGRLEVRHEAHDLPAFWRGEVLCMVIAQIVGVRFGKGRERSQNDCGVLVVVGQGRDCGALAPGLGAVSCRNHLTRVRHFLLGRDSLPWCKPQGFVLRARAGAFDRAGVGLRPSCRHAQFQASSGRDRSSVPNGRVLLSGGSV